jgi:NADPH-dependent 2,4-dienoyl-CoA reductase/sulfur reductase-like enzyme
MHNVVIIGAGPAGLSASLAAAAAGAPVLLIDSNPRLGGQYWRMSADDFQDQHNQHFDLDTGLLLINAVKARKEIEVWSGAQIWSATNKDGKNTLRVIYQGKERIVNTENLILCTGAYDRTLPFPGWDIPGVMTPGGVQSLLKGHGVLAGKRVVVAGSGPFLLPVAAGVVKAGGSVVALLEANKSRRWLTSFFVLLENTSKIKEAFYYIKTISEAKVRARFGQAVIAAHAASNGELESVDIAKIDRNFRIKKVQNIKCDVAAIGWGFTADTSLAGSLGCNQLVAKDDGVVVWVDSKQQTSIPGVFAAGEITGIGGSDLSMAEGVIAGISAAKFVGCNVEVLKAHRKRRAKRQRFANALIRAYPIKPGWKSWLRDETIICRCEEVCLSDLKHSINELGATDSRTAKLLTRCGMGLCQGRICGRFVVDLVANELNLSPTDTDRISAVNRPIITPIPLGILALGE